MLLNGNILAAAAVDYSVHTHTVMTDTEVGKACTRCGH
jgi:hypothetical protein